MKDVTQEFVNPESQTFNRIPEDRFGPDHFNMLEYVVERALTNGGKLPATFFLSGGYHAKVVLKNREVISGYDNSDVMNDLIEAGMVRDVETQRGTRFAPTEKGMQTYLAVLRNVIRSWETNQPLRDAYNNVELPREPRTPPKRVWSVGPVMTQPEPVKLVDFVEELDKVE